MHGMQLSIFADADADVTDDVAPRLRARRAPLATSAARHALAAHVAAVQAAQEPDSHAHAVDAVLTAVTPRITVLARLFVRSWPVAHVEVEDLTQEVLLEVAASLHEAPDTSEAHTQAWLSCLAMRVLHDLWRAAVQDADDHGAALAVLAVELEPDASAPHSDNTDDWEDEPADTVIHGRAA